MIETYAKQFAAHTANGGRSAPAWLATMRHAAFEEFRRAGFPSPRDEEWRFTSVAPIARAELSTTAPTVDLSFEAIEPLLFGHPDWPRFVFVNGRFQPNLSLLPNVGGVILEPISATLNRDPALLEQHLGRQVAATSTPFTALNTAFAKDGVFLRVGPGQVINAPIHLLFVTTGEADGVGVHPRTVIVVEEGSRVQLIENYVTLRGRPKFLTNAVTEVKVGKDAWVEHSRIQRESDAAFHVGYTHVDQDRASHYRSFSFAMGASISRHDLHTRLTAPGTEALLYGLYFGHDDQVVDNHTTIYHDQPDCRSWEVYKGILDDRAHGVFNGKILVQPEAQKTDAKQTNRALLLSDSARIDTKPQLEIFADDVKCTHGATVGQLDQLASFYLRSRGIPAIAAERLLVYAFAAEVLAEVSSLPVRHALDRLVHQRLSALG